MGCASYEFYPEPETGAERCSLFAGTVKQSIDVEPYVPNVWYDLACGVPVSTASRRALRGMKRARDVLWGRHGATSTEGWHLVGRSTTAEDEGWLRIASRVEARGIVE